MKKEKINNHVFEFYESIGELPIERFHDYSRYMLVASGVGDTLGDIDKHITKVIGLMAVDTQKARQELLNLRQCLFMVANKQDVSFKGFFFFTRSVDGKVWKDFSDSGIDALFALAQGESVARVKEVQKIICERIDDELQRYFPEMFDDSRDKNLCDLLRKKALLQIDEIMNAKDNSKAIEELSNKILEKYEPKDFENDKAVIEIDRQFENMCLILSKEFQGGVKGYTVKEFYSAYNLLKAQQEEIKKINKRRK